MREITSHKVNDCNSQLEIHAVDEPGPGGANHLYHIKVPPHAGLTLPTWYAIAFQNGAIKEAGVNGLTHEALLAIVIDRLEAFQRGPYAHPANAKALEHLNEAVAALASRTKERVERGVEGTMQV